MAGRRWMDCHAGENMFSTDRPRPETRMFGRASMQVLIRSARLQLSPFKMADAEEVFECITPAIARFMRWEPPKSLNEYKANREARSQANDPSVFSFVIRRSDTMECLGIAGLDEADQPTPELGIWLKEAAHGHGYERKPLKRLLNGRRKLSRRRASFTP
jgi:RimJ/RimL family protein N-acetyltransferase